VTAKQARAQILHDSDLNAYNSFENPDRITIKPHEAALDGSQLRLTLPPLSVTTVTVQLG
jgi:alpha-N-arabinofuranosidase